MPETIKAPNYDLVRDRLIKTREREGWSLRDIKERTGLSPATISRFETKKSVPDIPTLAALTDLLKLDRGDVFNAPEETTQDTPSKVRAHLRADKNLDARTADMLAKSFELLYKEWAGDRPK